MAVIKLASLGDVSSIMSLLAVTIYYITLSLRSEGVWLKTSFLCYLESILGDGVNTTENLSRNMLD